MGEGMGSVEERCEGEGGVGKLLLVCIRAVRV